jgi:uncharacterized protein (TIGR00369 family)
MDEMPIMRFLGIRIDVPREDDVYVAELDVTPETLNSLEIVHGAAIAALIDHAGGYGAHALTGRGGPTSDMHIRYLGSAREGSVLRAESRVQRAGRTLIVMEVRVTDQDGRLIALGDLALAPADNEPASLT